MAKKKISISEARKQLPSLASEVRDTGATYSIVRHGQEVAQLIPPADNADMSPDLEKEFEKFFTAHESAIRKLADL